MFRRITQVTIHQGTDDNQPHNGGLSLADASVDRTDQIPDGGWRSNDVLGSSHEPSEPSVLDYFRMPVAKEKPRLRRTIGAILGVHPTFLGPTLGPTRPGFRQ